MTAPRSSRPPGPEHRDGTGLSRPVVVQSLIRLVINAAIPLLVYLLLRPHVHSDLTALVIGAAIPIAYTVGVFGWRRRVDPVGVIAIVCFGFGLLLVLATGGNELVFKLREDLWTGPLGLVCLISAAVRRPLFLGALQLAARRNAQIAERIRRPGVRRIATVATWVIGLILLVHAVVLVVLAVTTSTTTFLAVSRPISWGLVGGGLAALVWWIRRQHPDQWDREAGSPPAGSRPASQAPPHEQHSGRSSRER